MTEPLLACERDGSDHDFELFPFSTAAQRGHQELGGDGGRKIGEVAQGQAGPDAPEPVVRHAEPDQHRVLPFAAREDQIGDRQKLLLEAQESVAVAGFAAQIGGDQRPELTPQLTSIDDELEGRLGSSRQHGLRGQSVPTQNQVVFLACELTPKRTLELLGAGGQIAGHRDAHQARTEEALDVGLAFDLGGALPVGAGSAPKDKTSARF
jgi:hypothetical protein